MQPGIGPVWPLMVWASDMFGGRPEFSAWLRIASTSDFHHSPVTHTNQT